MAYVEFNALSTVLGGSFTARAFLPGLDRLDLKDARHQKRYPVLWLLHTDGESSLEFLKTPVEGLAERYGFIAIAPDLHHSMGVDMKWGPNVEKFLTHELRGIFRHILPVSELREENFIGGTGTGGYAALKCACKHPSLFSKAFSLNGILDMERLIARTSAGEVTGVPQTAEALEAVFDAVPPRTAGFNTTDTASLSAGSTLLTIILMVVGGGPGSTAGGVKTTTVFVILLHALSGVRRERSANAFGRSIGDDTLKKATAVLYTNLLLALVGAVAICAIQPLGLTEVLFETFSAIGTAGMTMGITRELLPLSRMIIVFLMYCGRVGSISFAVALLEKRAIPPVTLPREDITIG